MATLPQQRDHRSIYLAVRRDIPLADQLVQIAHAAFEAGQRWHADPSTCWAVVISVETQAELLKLAQRCASRGVEFVMFDEPDDAMGYTALCTEPLHADRRGVLRRYRLWA
jgi:hypothetical protein